MRKLEHYDSYTVTVLFHRRKAGNYRKVLRNICKWFEPVSGWERPIVEVYPSCVSKYRSERLLTLIVFVKKVEGTRGRYRLNQALMAAHAYPVTGLVALDDSDIC